MNRNVARLVAVIGAVCLLAVGGCSSGDDGSANGSSEGQHVTLGKGTKVASSLKDYAKSLLTPEGGTETRSDAQVAAIRKVAETGEVSVSDYESAWSDWKQCLVDLGYNTPVLDNFNGVIDMAAVDLSNLTEAQLSKFQDDESDCLIKHVLDLRSLYNKQNANTSLYSDPYAGAVDCLRKAGIVGKEYSATRFEEEYLDYRSGDTEVNFDDAVVRGCLVGNGLHIGWDDEPKWKALD